MSRGGRRLGGSAWSKWRPALAGVVALAALAALPVAARAEAGSISITGTPTVTRGLHGSFRVSGIAPTPDRGSFPDNEVEVRGVPASEPCATNGIQNAVDSKLGFDSQLHGPAPFSISWEPPVENYVEVGSYTLCAWLFGKEHELLASAQMAITVVKPELRLRELVPHHPIKVGQRARFGVRGRLPVPAYLETQILPPRILICGAETCHFRKIHKCASTPEAEEKLIDESESVTYPFYGDGEPVRRLPAGSFHLSRRLSAKSPGLYRMCSWLTEEGENQNPARLFVTAKWRVTR